MYLITNVLLDLVYKCYTQKDLSLKLEILNSPQRTNKDGHFICGLSTAAVYSIMYDDFDTGHSCSDMGMEAPYMMRSYRTGPRQK